MTKKELSQLYWLNREIEEEKRKLAELEAAASGCTAKITGLPHVGGAHDKIGDLATLIAEQRDFVDLKVRESVVEYNRLCRYILNVDDALVRKIMSARFVDHMTWSEVETVVGGGNNAESLRKKLNRYLKRH